MKRINIMILIWKTYAPQAFEDGPDRGVRNVGQYKPDAGETPKSRHS
jgi:hypothetical protein